MLSGWSAMRWPTQRADRETMNSKPIEAGDHVRLTESIAPQSLQRGAVGVVCSIWHRPTPWYEVEFETDDCPFGVRAVVSAEQVESVEPEAAHLASC
jgi:hypothetical protein